MTAALLSVIAVVVSGVALRPRPAPRRPDGATQSPASAPRSVRVFARPRRQRIDPAEVAAWCEGVARVVRSGSTLTTAVRTVRPPASCATTIERVVLALDRGAGLSHAAATSSPSPHLDLALVVIRACALNGGSPGEPLDRAAGTLRGRAAEAAERQTQSAQARMSALVMTLLPLAMLGLLLATSSTTRAAASTPRGLLTVALGGVLNLMGWRWMRLIIGAQQP